MRFSEKIEKFLFPLFFSISCKIIKKVIDLLIKNSNFGLTKENFTIVQVASSEGIFFYLENGNGYFIFHYYKGDQNLKDPLYVIGGTGVFTKNVEKELFLKYLN